MSKILLLCFMPFLAVADEVSPQQTTKDFSGYSLIETIPNTNENVELLRHLDAKIDEDGMDFWSDPTSANKPVEIRWGLVPVCFQTIYSWLNNEILLTIQI